MKKSDTQNMSSFDIVLDETTIRVQNNSNKNAKVYFKRERDRHTIYENHKFDPKVWSLIETNPWIDEKNTKIRLEIILESEIFLYLCDIKSGEITKLPSSNLQVKAYQVQPYTISVLMSGYNVTEYIEDALKSLFSAHPPEYYKIDYYLAIDGDEKLLEHIYRIQLPPFVKVYYAAENQGSFRIKNSLALKSDSEYILFFDCDDLALPGIFEHVEQLQKNQIIRFGGNTFSNHDPRHKSKLARPGGVIMQKRMDFLNLGGYQPWRCQGDDEYNRRAEANGRVLVDIEQPRFQYRILPTSLSNNPVYGVNSVYRDIYRKIIAENVATKKWPIPGRIHEADNLVRIL